MIYTGCASDPSSTKAPHPLIRPFYRVQRGGLGRRTKRLGWVTGERGRGMGSGWIIEGCAGLGMEPAANWNFHPPSSMRDAAAMCSLPVDVE